MHSATFVEMCGNSKRMLGGLDIAGTKLCFGERRPTSNTMCRVPDQELFDAKRL